MPAGDTLATLHPLGHTPPSANPGTLFRRNARWYLAFDQTTEEAVYWELLMPRFYSGGDITVNVWSIAAAGLVAGTVCWGGSLERLPVNFDQDGDSFDTEDVSSADTVDGTSGEPILSTITMTHKDSIVAGDCFRFKLARKVASDNLAGDAQVLAVELREA
jgi:hypothetical protein